MIMKGNEMIYVEGCRVLLLEGNRVAKEKTLTWQVVVQGMSWVMEEDEQAKKRRLVNYVKMFLKGAVLEGERKFQDQEL